MDKICHLCFTHYNDDPFFQEQPSHTPKQCLDILEFRYHEAETAFRNLERQYARAKMEYKTREAE